MTRLAPREKMIDDYTDRMENAVDLMGAIVCDAPEWQGD